MFLDSLLKHSIEGVHSQVHIMEKEKVWTLEGQWVDSVWNSIGTKAQTVLMCV